MGEHEEGFAPMTDRPIRASDQERESVVDVLRDAYTDGRLTLDLSVASHKSRRKMKMGAEQGQKIGIEFANVEKANLVPEI